MYTSGFPRRLYWVLRIIILSAFISSACTPTTPSPPPAEVERTGTPSPSPSPTASPTPDPWEGVPRSPYFEDLALLESTTVTLQPGDKEYTIRSAVIRDVNGDGAADAVFTLATYPENIPHPIVVLRGDGPVENIAGEVFPGGVPQIVHANQIFFADVDNDGREDLLISEAGNDHPPWVNPDAQVGIALNRGGGIFEDVSASVPEAAKGLRNYSLAAGDLFGDGITRIVLPSQAITGKDPHYHGPDRTGLLFWNGEAFEFRQNWIPMSLWWYPTNLYTASFMAVRDLDGDGLQDLYLSGNWTTPNHRVLYGSEDFPSAAQLVTLPNGPYGHTTWETFMQPGVDFANGADVNRVVFEDFDGDSDLDLVSIHEDVQNYKPGVFTDENHPWYEDVSENGGTIYGNVWFQVLRNEGDREFVDVTAQGRDVGHRYYVALLPLDVDLDGDLDLVGQYWRKSMLGECVQKWGSTFFINRGDLVFDTVEATDAFPELAFLAEQESAAFECDSPGLGLLFPTVITAEGTKGLLVAPLNLDPARPKLRVLRFETAGRFTVPD